MKTQCYETEKTSGQRPEDGEGPVREGAEDLRAGHPAQTAESRARVLCAEAGQSSGQRPEDGEGPVREGAEAPQEGHRARTAESRARVLCAEASQPSGRRPEDGEGPVREGAEAPQEGHRARTAESRARVLLSETLRQTALTNRKLSWLEVLADQARKLEDDNARMARDLGAYQGAGLRYEREIARKDAVTADQARKIKGLLAQLMAVKRERDAAERDINRVLREERSPCYMCARCGDAPHCGNCAKAAWRGPCAENGGENV